MESLLCPENLIIDEHEKSSSHNTLQENGRDYKNFDDVQYENSTEISEDQTENNEFAQPERLVSSTIASGEETSTKLLLLTTAVSTKVNTPVVDQAEIITTTTITTSTTTARIPAFIKSAPNNFSDNHNINNFTPNWRMRHYSDLQYSPSSPYQTTDYFASPGPTAMIMMRDKWRNKSGCFFSCIQYSKGLQTVVSKYDYSTSIRLCESPNVPCDKIMTTYEYSTNLCMKYQMKVRGLR